MSRKEFSVSPKSITVYHAVDDGRNIAQNKGKIQHRLFLRFDKLEDVPAELFAVKISQSKKKELVNKPTFKYFSYRIGDEEWTSQAGSSMDIISLPVEVIKENIIHKLGAYGEELQFSIAVKSSGKFLNVEAGDDLFIVYDETLFPDALGFPGYYLRYDADVEVQFKEAESNGNTYYQLKLFGKDEATAEDLFYKPRRGALAFETDSVSAEYEDAHTPSFTPNNDSVDFV